MKAVDWINYSVKPHQHPVLVIPRPGLAKWHGDMDSM